MQIYAIEDMRRRVLALLRQRPTAISRDAMATQLGLPSYAVDAGLASALEDQLVTYAEGQGWWIASHRPELLEPKEGLVLDNRAQLASIFVATVEVNHG